MKDDDMRGWLIDLLGGRFQFSVIRYGRTWERSRPYFWRSERELGFLRWSISLVPREGKA